MTTAEESDQVVQRRANLEELRKLGVRPYPHRFDPQATIDDIVRAHGEKTGEALDAEQITTRTAGRILAIRSFGKANFLVLSDGKARIQVYIRQDALSERDFQIFKLLDFGDWVGVEGRLFRTKTNEFTIWASYAGVPREVPAAAAGKVARPDRRRDPLPAALPRSHRQSRRAPRVRGAQPGGDRDPRVPDRPRLPRSRDADDAADRRRRARASVQDAPQRARHAALHAHRARALPQAADRRRHRARLRDQPELPQRGDLDAAQPRVHDARVLLELRRLYRPDDAHRDDAVGGGRARRSAPTDDPFGDHAISLKAPFRRLSLREAAREAASRRLGEPVDAGDLRSRDTAAALAARLGIAVDPAMGPGKIAAEIFEALCEDDLVQPTFVYDFPTEVSPLSKQKPDDPDTVERFELYIGGFEVANAFSELNDPAEQRRRFEEQLRSAPAATTKRMPWTRTTSGRSSSACRRPPAKASASTGWSCC